MCAVQQIEQIMFNYLLKNKYVTDISSWQYIYLQYVELYTKIEYIQYISCRNIAYIRVRVHNIGRRVVCVCVSQTSI